MHGGRRERTRGPRPQGGGGCNLRGEGGGVVTRVLQGLHTLHTFFREKGRGVSQVFFFFSFLREKKNLRPLPWDFALAEACKPCKVCNPEPTSRPQAPGLVTRVLQGLHTLHTFFREKGREVSQVFFFFSFLREKKILRPTPGTLPSPRRANLARCATPNPPRALKPQGAPPRRGPPSARPPPPRRACARPARARARARARVGGARFKLGVRLGLQTAPDPNPNPGRLVAPAGLGGVGRAARPVRARGPCPSPPARRTLPVRRGAQRAPG